MDLRFRFTSLRISDVVCINLLYFYVSLGVPEARKCHGCAQVGDGKLLLLQFYSSKSAV